MWTTQFIVHSRLCNPKWRIKPQLLIPKTFKNNIQTTTIYRVPLFWGLAKCNKQINLIECKFQHYYDGLLERMTSSKSGNHVHLQKEKWLLCDEKWLTENKIRLKNLQIQKIRNLYCTSKNGLISLARQKKK